MWTHELTQKDNAKVAAKIGRMVVIAKHIRTKRTSGFTSMKLNTIARSVLLAALGCGALFGSETHLDQRG